MQSLDSVTNKVTDNDTPIRQRAFRWDEPSLDESRKGGGGNGTEAQSTVITCRNSVQGKALLADDRGNVKCKNFLNFIRIFFVLLQSFFVFEIYM